MKWAFLFRPVVRHMLQGHSLGKSNDTLTNNTVGENSDARSS